MRAVWVFAVLLTGCMDELPHEDPTVVTRTGACSDLEGTTFRSVDQGECGLTPDGVALCHWHITFAAHDDTKSRFTWGHSDVGEQGFVTCEGDTIRSDETTAYDGHVDANLDLMWDGAAYLALAP
ncbi:MAG: hypothetical protein H0T42_32165 [Deltaproteobacteria bacterium]|nr:hypothetical protein [Deltaproteobacteria bacterium]